MKTTIKALTIAAVLSMPALAMAAPGTGIAGTDHDFATKAGLLLTQTDGSGNWVATSGTVGLCSYCHTPHSALSTALLWNHKLSSNTFTWDDTATAGNTTYASMAPSYKGPTVKCLACHDGSVAIGDVNMYKEKTAIYNTYQVGTPVPNNAGANTAPNIIKKIGGGGAMKGNHPVGMPYPFNQAASTYNGITTGNRVPLDEFAANPVNTNSQYIKLYNDNGSGVITNGANGSATGIECSSCHDPHNKQTTDTLLLRGKIAGSQAADGYICVQCHIK